MLYFPLWKKLLVAALCLAGLYFSLPNFLEEGTEAPVPEHRVQLGLDLQGGSHLLLEVDVPVYIKEQYEGVRDEVRQALREARVGYVNLSASQYGVQVSLRDPGDRDRAEELLNALSQDVYVDQVGNDFTLEFAEDYLQELQHQVIAQSIEIVRRRVDETGTREPVIQRQGDTRIVVQVPGLQDPERLKHLLGQTAKMTFHLLDEQEPFPASRTISPPDSRLLTGRDGQGYYMVKKRVELSGELLTNATAGFTEGGQAAVFFKFNSLGARKFGEITKQNVNKPFAIVLDNKVITAPVINEPILAGSGQITGNFTVQSANDLALLLRAGALPAPLNILEERTVGPSLGQDSIAAGASAMALGAVLVVVFMLISYGLFGVFSNVALAMNVILIIAVLSLFDATLTLPGIAGIVLTMGMAVDANVLIFERIREEIRLGKSPYAAVDGGFKQAFGTILDSNLTTLIGTLILYIFGSGVVRGFAVTLSVGIITSMFSAIMLTRLMVVWWLKSGKQRAIPI